MSFGLLSTGFVPKPLQDIRDDLDAAARDIWGASVPLGDKTLLGGYNGIMADRFAELWELGEAIYASDDPDGATAEALEALCALTGTRRDAATESTVTLTLTGTPGTTVAAGSRAAAASAGNPQFATDEDISIAALDAWVALTLYTIGDRVTNASRAYVCITTGTSDSSGGPTTTAADITDDGAHWRYLGEGTGAGDVASTCTVTGPTEAVSGDITTIVTPVGGWSSVVNLLDADVGSDVETDGDLRVKREDELAADDAPNVDAIREALLKTVAEGGAGATAATVFENVSDVTDGDGLPPHSVECLVKDGDDQDVVDVIGRHVAAGINTYGNTSGTFTDSEGTDHTINYTRPDEVDIYVDIAIAYDADLYPADGDAQVKAAIVAFGDAFATGRDVTASGVGAQAFTVPGVLDVTPVYIGTAPAPGSSTTIAIALRELAVFDTSRISVTSSPVTP